MRNRALRPFATILSLLLMASTTVQAGPISISEVVQVLGSYQNSARVSGLRLRNVSQSANSIVSNDVSARPSNDSRSSSTEASSVNVTDTSIASAPTSADTLLAGVALNADGPQTNVDVISQGDLEGSICDCGEIPSAHRRFPLWPLLFLAVIPFFFIHHHETPTPTPSITPSPPPSPTPTPQIPEPTSLLLLGSGLAAVGASLRRRYVRGKLEKEISSAQEEA
jgi:PEP-CTERM motif